MNDTEDDAPRAEWATYLVLACALTAAVVAAGLTIGFLAARCFA